MNNLSGGITSKGKLNGSLAIGKIGGISECKKNVYVGESPEEYTEVWFDPSEEGIIDEVATKKFVEERTVKLETSLEQSVKFKVVGEGITVPPINGDGSYIYDDTEIRKLINETNKSLDNITNRVEYIENNGIGGGSLNLRDVLDGEIFTIGTIDIPTTPTVTYGQIVVSKSSTTITEGSTDTFTVKLDKAPTNNQVVTLNKNNSDVALSSYSLTFTPSNYSIAQTVTITVAEDNTDYSNETCIISISSPNVSTKTLTVNIIDNDEEQPANIPVSSVSLDRSSHTLEVGQTIQLTATVLPSNATNKSVIWSASNSNCTVDNGLIEAINSGSCVITCTTVDGNKTATCNITIVETEIEEPTISYTNYIYNSDTYANPKDISQHPILSNNASIYWQNYLSTKTVSNGVATVLFSGANGFFQCRPFTGDGKTYYCSYLVDTVNTANVSCIIYSSDAKYTKDLGDGWTLYCSVVEDSKGNFTSKIVDKRTSDWTPIQTKEWIKICLTDIYPDGNYPSAEECSNLFEYVSGISG